MDQNFNRLTNTLACTCCIRKARYIPLYTPSIDVEWEQWEKARGRTRSRYTNAKEKDWRSVTLKERKRKNARRKNRRKTGTLSSVNRENRTRGIPFLVTPRGRSFRFFPRALYFHTLPFSPLFSLTSNGCNYSSKFLTGR